MNDNPEVSVGAEADQASTERDRQAQPIDAEESPRLDFPVVGIGASAGGLESMLEFFGTMRPDSGMAFVVIQHLPPDRDTLIPEILGRKTSMPVVQIADAMRIEPDHVYVIRPGRTISMREGCFRLGDSVDKPMHSRPVDDFFKSLAEEQRERAIAVVMSGMGSNGAAGAQAVKAVGGLCIAQDPETAQFPSMPRHLIDAGYADYILPPRDMPETLLAYAGHPYAQNHGGTAADVLAREQQHIREVLAVLRTRTRHDFTGYKKPTLIRRIQRRMGLVRVTKLSQYARILRQTPSEITALADDLLIHVTGFFRDPEMWEALRQKVVVPLVASRPPESEIRGWVAACSSGEEAYTLAILLVEEAERVGKPLDIKLFATDTAARTLQNARQGVYPGGIESEVSPERLQRFFQREDAVYRIRQDLRERVVFAPQDLLQDPPFSRLDIVTCRNLLIYLERTSSGAFSPSFTLVSAMAGRSSSAPARPSPEPRTCSSRSTRRPGSSGASGRPGTARSSSPHPAPSRSPMKPGPVRRQRCPPSACSATARSSTTTPPQRSRWTAISASFISMVRARLSSSNPAVSPRETCSA